MEETAKRFFKKGKKTPFAVRIKESLPPVESVQASKEIRFIPELSAVAFNYQTGGTMFESYKLNPPIRKCEMKAMFRVEVWESVNGKKNRLMETWFFRELPEGNQTPEDFIEEVTMLELKHAAQPKPASFFKTETAKQIDPMENAKQATLLLLKREYPLLARALDAKKPTPETCQAFIADCVRLTGCTDANVNLSDAKFVAMLSDAWQTHDRRDVRKSKVDALDWHLANPHNWAALHALPIEEITDKANKATGFNLSVAAIEKRIERLKLITPRKRGKPAKT